MDFLSTSGENPAVKRKSALTATLKRLKRFFRGPVAPKKFHLHLGVHKTATTYTQTALANNNRILADNGILYWDLQQTRKNITPYFGGLSRKKNERPQAECRVHLNALFDLPEVKTAKRVLISDENILGFIKEIIRNGGYRGVYKRLKPIRDILNDDVKVFITIRNYADFFSSVYCELITTKPFIPFEQVRNNPKILKFSWVSVYKDLVRVFGKENVVVFEHEAMVSNLGLVIHDLLGKPLSLEMPKKQVRVSPSGNAVDFIRQESGRASDKTLRQIVKCATETYPRNTENPTYDPWTPEERALLDERYRSDLLKIALRKP